MQFAERTSSPQLERAFAEILPKLQEVESSLSMSIDSPIESVSDIRDYVLTAGGKRIRPALLLVVSRLLSYQGDQDVLMATVIEYIHSATLIHDDVIDGAETRRGRPSVNLEFGNGRTVLFGDYLYAKALKLVLDTGDLRVLRCLNDTILRMIEGEILALEKEGSIDLSIDDYFEIVRRKTGVLFGATCEIPALIAPEGTRYAERLREYGISIGVAFQLIDDLLDYTADEATLGKPVLSDLCEGRLTLPLILALPDCSPTERQAVATVLEERAFATVSAEEILSIVRRHDTLDRTRAMAHEEADRARNLLKPLPEGEAREALGYAPDFILNRER